MIKWNIDQKNYTKKELEMLSEFIEKYDYSISKDIDCNIENGEYKDA